MCALRVKMEENDLIKSEDTCFFISAIHLNFRVNFANLLSLRHAKVISIERLLEPRYYISLQAKFAEGT